MQPSLVTLTLGVALRNDILPLLLEYLPEEQIAHRHLLEEFSLQDVVTRFSPAEREPTVTVRWCDDQHLRLSTSKIRTALQHKLSELEAQGFDTILLFASSEFTGLHCNNALLLESDRLLPPLIASIVDDHQVGILVSLEDHLHTQSRKWRNLSKSPCFAIASPWQASEGDLIDAALSLQEQGADVVMMDCIGYQPRHREFLQQLLGIPVLLSNVLLAKLAAELMV